MAKRPLPSASSGGKDVLMVNQLTVKKGVQFPEIQSAVASATGGSKDDNGKKDDTLTKDEFNSGFQDGVGSIKEGFAGLGAGLGPLTVIVDFVKGFVSKIGNIFQIFKGLFQILMSIPRAIANAFKKNKDEEKDKDKKLEKDKDKKDKKKQKEQDKKDKASLNERKKGRGGFAKFATMLKPALIIGAILAISFGLLKLYNWLAGKGLFEYFSDLSFAIKNQILDFKIMFAEWTDNDVREKQLKEERATLGVERLLERPDLISEANREALETAETADEKAILLSGISATMFGNEKAVTDTVLENNEKLRNKVEEAYNFSLENVTATTTAMTREERTKKIQELNLEAVNASLGVVDTGILQTGMAGDAEVFEQESQGFNLLTAFAGDGFFKQETKGFVGMFDENGDPLTLGKLQEALQANAPEGMEITPADVLIFLDSNPELTLGPGDTVVRAYGGNAIRPRLDMEESGELVYFQNSYINDLIENPLANLSAAMPGGSGLTFSMLNTSRQIGEGVYTNVESLDTSRDEDIVETGVLDEKVIDDTVKELEQKTQIEQLKDLLEADGELSEEDLDLIELLTAYEEAGFNVKELPRKLRKKLRTPVTVTEPYNPMVGQYGGQTTVMMPMDDVESRDFLIEQLDQLIPEGMGSGTQVFQAIQGGDNIMPMVAPTNDTGSDTSGTDNSVVQQQ